MRLWKPSHTGLSHDADVSFCLMSWCLSWRSWCAAALTHWIFIGEKYYSNKPCTENWNTHSMSCTVFPQVLLLFSRSWDQSEKTVQDDYILCTFSNLFPSNRRVNKAELRFLVSFRTRLLTRILERHSHFHRITANTTHASSYLTIRRPTAWLTRNITQQASTRMVSLRVAIAATLRYQKHI
jgi:hypothetical protein